MIIIQRFFDVLISSLAILLFSPLLLVTLLILRFTGENEVFYEQARVGKGGLNFSLLKFATMIKNSPNIGTKEITIKDDPRVLPFGKILRKTKLNELPQLLNVLKGDMSIVGPRPMVPGTYSLYSAKSRSQIDLVKPGLTGIGSIFFRDEEIYLNNQEDPQKFYQENIIPFKSTLEVWFVENQSVANYFKIILVTSWVIFFPKSKNIHKFFKNLPEVPDFMK